MTQPSDETLHSSSSSFNLFPKKHFFRCMSHFLRNAKEPAACSLTAAIKYCEYLVVRLPVFGNFGLAN